MQAKWFFMRNKTKHGPVSSKQLKELAESGKLESTDLVWRDGFSEWKPAAILPITFVSHDPVCPPLNQLCDNEPKDASTRKRNFARAHRWMFLAIPALFAGLGAVWYIRLVDSNHGNKTSGKGAVIGNEAASVGRRSQRVRVPNDLKEMLQTTAVSWNEFCSHLENTRRKTQNRAAESGEPIAVERPRINPDDPDVIEVKAFIDTLCKAQLDDAERMKKALTLCIAARRAGFSRAKVHALLGNGVDAAKANKIDPCASIEITTNSVFSAIAFDSMNEKSLKGKQPNDELTSTNTEAVKQVETNTAEDSAQEPVDRWGAVTYEATNYYLTDLGVLGNAIQVNNNGSVLGEYYSRRHVNTINGTFLWRAGEVVVLQLPSTGHRKGSSRSVYGTAINDNETIVGNLSKSLDGKDVLVSFMFREGKFEELIVGHGNASCGAASINIKGEVVGNLYVPSPKFGIGYYKYGSVIRRERGTDESEEGIGYVAINDRGDILAMLHREKQKLWELVIVRDKQYENLSTTHNLYGYGMSINNNGDTCGITRGVIGADASAFAILDGKLTIIEAPSPNVGGSMANSINSMQEVVGSLYFVSGTPSHAFYFKDNRVVDLTIDVVPDDRYVLEEATGINDAGLIVGRAYTQLGTTPEEKDGRRVSHAFLLTPKRGL